MPTTIARDPGCTEEVSVSLYDKQPVDKGVRLGGELQVVAGLVDSFFFRALEEADRRSIDDVWGKRGACTVGEEAANELEAVDASRSESPSVEKAPDLESRGRTAHSFEVPALPSS